MCPRALPMKAIHPHQLLLKTPINEPRRMTDLGSTVHAIGRDCLGVELKTEARSFGQLNVARLIHD